MKEHGTARVALVSIQATIRFTGPLDIRDAYLALRLLAQPTVKLLGVRLPTLERLFGRWRARTWLTRWISQKRVHLFGRRLHLDARDIL